MIANPVSGFELVRMIDLQPPGQSAFFVWLSEEDDPADATDLADELAVQTTRKLHTIQADRLTPADIIGQISQCDPKSAVILILGLGVWSDSNFAALDVNRSALTTGASFVLVVNLETMGRLLNLAPNLASFIGANVFRRSTGNPAMSRNQVEERLDQLRSHYQMTDAEILAQAEQGQLAADPELVEWLVLLGRGRLVR